MEQLQVFRNETKGVIYYYGLYNGFSVKIILVETTAKFWDGTGSASSELAKERIEYSWQKSMNSQTIHKGQKK